MTAPKDLRHRLLWAIFHGLSPGGGGTAAAMSDLCDGRPADGRLATHSKKAVSKMKINARSYLSPPGSLAGLLTSRVWNK